MSPRIHQSMPSVWVAYGFGSQLGHRHFECRNWYLFGNFLFPPSHMAETCRSMAKGRRGTGAGRLLLGCGQTGNIRRLSMVVGCRESYFRSLTVARVCNDGNVICLLFARSYFPFFHATN